MLILGGGIIGKLPHEAMLEAHLAAEVMVQRRVIPSVAYTDAKVAWVGLTRATGDSGAVAKIGEY